MITAILAVILIKQIAEKALERHDFNVDRFGEFDTVFCE
jgi:hypothetical protein